MAWATPQFTPDVVNAAGKKLAGLEFPVVDEAGLQALAVLNNWRSAHAYPLNTFQITLRNKARKIERTVIVAQRSKRLRFRREPDRARAAEIGPSAADTAASSPDGPFARPAPEDRPGDAPAQPQARSGGVVRLLLRMPERSPRASARRDPMLGRQMRGDDDPLDATARTPSQERNALGWREAGDRPMISSPDRQIFHRELRGFLCIAISSQASRPGEPVPPTNIELLWLMPAQAGDYWPAEHVERGFAEGKLPIEREAVIIMPAPCCACCGEKLSRMPGAPQLVCVTPGRDPAKWTYRCPKHRDRNPCLVEGCSRTRAANGHFSNSLDICGEHWRRYVPRGSRLRKTYLAHHRRAKRLGGWTPELRRKFWRFWDQLVEIVRRRSEEGHIDEAEINRIMGWN
jgi:hypothetical protein